MLAWIVFASASLLGLGLAWFLKKKFIAASNLHEAVKAAEKISRQSFVPIINLLGEHYRSRKKIEKAVNDYCYLIDLLVQFGVKGRISVKPTQIGLAFSQDLYRWNLMRVLRRAKIQKIPVEIDIESSRYKYDTLQIFYEIPGEYDARQAVQIYFYNQSERDIEALLKKGRKIRLVKGAYAEGDLAPEQIESQMRNCFQHLLLRAHDPAIAIVRDEYLLGSIDDFVTGLKTLRKNSFEIQMLDGRRNDLKRKYQAKGYRVAVYMAVGPWYKALPYLWRRIKEVLKSYLCRTPY